jgi:hypothetical protein
MFEGQVPYAEMNEMLSGAQRSNTANSM